MIHAHVNRKKKETFLSIVDYFDDQKNKNEISSMRNTLNEMNAKRNNFEQSSDEYII